MPRGGGSNPGAGKDEKKGSTVQILVSQGPATVIVPNAVGLSEATARDRIAAAGFKVTEAKIFANQPAGTVTAQAPAAGAKTAKGASIRINVSKGTGVVIVPNVVGQTLGDAETQLAKSGLTGAVQFHVPSTQPAGTSSPNTHPAAKPARDQRSNSMSHSELPTHRTPRQAQRSPNHRTPSPHRPQSATDDARQLIGNPRSTYGTPSLPAGVVPQRPSKETVPNAPNDNATCRFAARQSPVVRCAGGAFRNAKRSQASRCEALTRPFAAIPKPIARGGAR